VPSDCPYCGFALDGPDGDSPLCRCTGCNSLINASIVTPPAPDPPPLAPRRRPGRYPAAEIDERMWRATDVLDLCRTMGWTNA